MAAAPNPAPRQPPPPCQPPPPNPPRNAEASVGANAKVRLAMSAISIFLNMRLSQFKPNRRKTPRGRFGSVPGLAHLLAVGRLWQGSCEFLPKSMGLVPIATSLDHFGACSETHASFWKGDSSTGVANKGTHCRHQSRRPDSRRRYRP